MSAYHKEPNALKTDAPNSVIWDVMRAWCKDHPPKKEGKKSKKKQMKKQKLRDAKSGGDNADGGEEGIPGNISETPKSAGDLILAIEPKISVDFTIPKGLDKKKKAQRFPINPEKNWGPKPRATNKRKALESSSEAPVPKETRNDGD